MCVCMLKCISALNELLALVSLVSAVAVAFGIVLGFCEKCKRDDKGSEEGE